jgi:ribosomal protein L3 glutamine methyltransferase
MNPDDDLLHLFTRIRDWVRYAMSEFQEAQLFYGHGTDNALDEAVYLILHTLNLPLNLPANLFESVLTLQERKKIYAIIHKRIQSRLPAAYLTHESFFMGLPFFVDDRVLIPRSPIAELIEKQFHPWSENPHEVENILDLCTGSGCIAVACAKMFPHANIVGTDISQDALEVAKINLEKHHVSSQIKLIKSDLFDKIPPQKFDVIISNPPYVNKIDMESLPKEYHHEPELALKAGEDGLDIIRKILSTAKKYLSDTGILIVEVGNSAKALMREYPHIEFIWPEFEHGDSEIFIITKDQL